LFDLCSKIISEVREVKAIELSVNELTDNSMKISYFHKSIFHKHISLLITLTSGVLFFSRCPSIISFLFLLQKDLIEYLLRKSYYRKFLKSFQAKP
jgi:hypothetical protein